MWRLLVRYGEAGESDFPLTGEITIGRDPDNTIWLNDAAVSRRHARLYLEGERAFVEDRGSANGILVGDAPIAGPTELRPGSVLMIGGHKLLVTWTGLGPAPSTEKHAAATFKADLLDILDQKLDGKMSPVVEPKPPAPTPGDSDREDPSKTPLGKSGCFTLLAAMTLLLLLISWMR